MRIKEANGSRHEHRTPSKGYEVLFFGFPMPLFTCRIQSGGGDLRGKLERRLSPGVWRKQVRFLSGSARAAGSAPWRLDTRVVTPSVETRPSIFSPALRRAFSAKWLSREIPLSSRPTMRLLRVPRVRRKLVIGEECGEASPIVVPGLEYLVSPVIGIFRNSHVSFLASDILSSVSRAMRRGEGRPTGSDSAVDHRQGRERERDLSGFVLLAQVRAAYLVSVSVAAREQVRPSLAPPSSGSTDT